MTKFSIIMPCYNAGQTVDRTIASILHQTVSDWELICVDDGSTDMTLNRLQAWAKRDPRIRIIERLNSGPAAARNHGAAQAKGDILAFCDADDVWEARKLFDLEDAYEDDSVDAVFGRVVFFSEETKANAYSTVPQKPLTIPMLMGENPVCTMSNMSIRRAFFHASEGLRTDMVHNEDLEWLIRLVGLGAKIVGRQKLHIWYRTSTGGLSADLAKMAASREIALQTAERFGFRRNGANEAIYARYLARRALRLNETGLSALKYSVEGMKSSPTAFLFPLRRGALVLAASVIAPVVPPSLRKQFVK